MEETIYKVTMKKYFIREPPKLLLPYKNELCATKFSKMTFSVSYRHKELLIRCCRYSRYASDGSTWQKAILIWRKQPSNLIH